MFSCSVILIAYRASNEVHVIFAAQILLTCQILRPLASRFIPFRQSFFLLLQKRGEKERSGSVFNTSFELTYIPVSAVPQSCDKESIKLVFKAAFKRTSLRHISQVEFQYIIFRSLIDSVTEYPLTQRHPLSFPHEKVCLDKV